MKDALRRLLQEAVAAGVFPAGQAVVIHRGREVFSDAAGDATVETRFDLASLTKVMATTAVFLRLWAEGAVAPETPVGGGLSFADLLFHRSGLPGFVPFFADAIRARPELLAPDCPGEVRAEVRAEVVARARAIPPEAPVGAAVVYSDVGFIRLGEALAEAGGAPLDALYDRLVAGPLGLGARFHRLSTLSDADLEGVAPTGRSRPREPAPGQEGLWAPFPFHPTRPGEVDDDNCFVLDGVAGHAGLFGTARDVARFGQAALEELSGRGLIASAELWARAVGRDPVTPGSSRGMGFDTPGPASSAGAFIGDTAPGAFGHLGFTGTSLWVDRGRELVVALVTNRTLAGRANLGIRAFRPRFHDAVVEGLRSG